MTESTAGPAQESTYSLEYSLLTSRLANPDFQGRGRLVVRPAGPTYAFSGRPRGLFASGRTELILGPEEICDVGVVGRTLQFKTSAGRSGAKGRPFVCHFRDHAEAQAVAGMLPAKVSAVARETRDFTAKLHEVADGSKPWTSATNGILAANVVAFVVMGLLGAGWLETANLMPYVLYGANNGAATTDGEWWRLGTSMFMHYGLIHLLLNMWALFQAGHLAEKLFGRGAYLLAYLGSGIAGGFLSIVWHGDKSWSAGASGAVFGVFGAVLGFMLKEKQSLPGTVYRSLMKSTLSFAGYNILYGFARAGIDNAAHVGGFAGGIGLGWLLALPLETDVRKRMGSRHLQLGLAAFGALLAVGIAFTPRFDYRVSEELAWEDANRAYVGRESGLLEHHAQALPALTDAVVGEDHAQWIESSLIPFYEEWNRALASLSLSPERATARTRRIMLSVFELKLRSFRNLAAGLRKHDDKALARYRQEEATVVREVEKLRLAVRK